MTKQTGALRDCANVPNEVRINRTSGYF